MKLIILKFLVGFYIKGFVFFIIKYVLICVFKYSIIFLDIFVYFGYLYFKRINIKMNLYFSNRFWRGFLSVNEGISWNFDSIVLVFKDEKD